MDGDRATAGEGAGRNTEGVKTREDGGARAGVDGCCSAVVDSLAEEMARCQRLAICYRFVVPGVCCKRLDVLLRGGRWSVVRKESKEFSKLGDWTNSQRGST